MKLRPSWYFYFLESYTFPSNKEAKFLLLHPSSEQNRVHIRTKAPPRDWSIPGKQSLPNFTGLQLLCKERTSPESKVA